MRIASRLMIACAATLAASALTATNAAAQEEVVEVVNEATGNHCSVALDNCQVHAVTADPVGTPTAFINHSLFGEAVVVECNEELVVAFNEDGSGHAFLAANNHAGDPDCTTEECIDPAEQEWPITNMGENAPNAAHFTMTFCLSGETTGSDSHCTIEVDIAETATEHQYELVASDDPCLGAGQDANEVTGHWLTEADPENLDEVEIIHQ